MTFYLGTPPSRDAIHLLPAYEPSLILSPVAAVLHPLPYLVTLAVVAYDFGLLLFWLAAKYYDSKSAFSAGDLGEVVIVKAFS